MSLSVGLKFHPIFLRTLLKTIICGQILSLTLCGVGTSSAALAKWYDVRVPGFQAFLTYTTLALTAGTKLAYDSNKFKEILKERGWKYLILGLADVEANYLLVKAYTFTTLTSAQVCNVYVQIDTLSNNRETGNAFFKISYRLQGACLIAPFFFKCMGDNVSVL